MDTRALTGEFDHFEDLRTASERLRDSERELRQRVERGELSEEDYQALASELEQSEADFERARDLEREAPPGELEDAFPEEPLR